MTNSKGRIAAGIVAVVMACTALVGCGGRQQPPTTGTCHPGREWVPPAQDENGQWRDGYCRSTGG
ncbi:hypothetical protein [Sandaracinus amylolyticus]|uniref:hypothetical protein n=1 Tax=Sandaracinus amylolyticus TaxID=927083 RepID=UPI0012EE3F92|nr:hypothetical protein [Sandaracinus amylolyticus]